jgi:branched-chain amino acid aminotransferase
MGGAKSGRTMGEHDNTKVLMDGKFVPWKDANLHVSTHAFLYGTAVFEGIRAYWNEKEKQLNVWCLREHADRLARNARMMGFDKGPSAQQVHDWTIRLLEENKFRQDVYIRPIVYLGEGTVRVRPTTQAVRTLLFAFVLKKYFEHDGLKCMVSSWVRPQSSVLPPMGKVNGAYANSFLASTEATRAGYDEAIMLNHRGLVSEGPAENFFMVRDGSLITPPFSADILDGVTRGHVMELAKDLGVPAIERDIPRVELYAADEMFFCGTGVEIEPIISIDGRKVGDGKTGPVTSKIRELFRKGVYGDLPKYRGKLTPVYKPVVKAARKGA